MNTKTTFAIVAALLMVCAASVFAASDDSSGDSKEQAGTINIDITNTNGITSIIYFSESGYTASGYQYKAEWGAALSGTDTTEGLSFEGIGARDTSSGSAFSSVGDGLIELKDSDVVANALNVSLSPRAGSTGVDEYNLKISCVDGSTKAGTVYLVLKCQVTIATHGIVLDPLYYVIPVSIQAHDALTVSLDNGTFVQYQTYGSGDAKIIAKIGSQSVNLDDYAWYATGLPAGLSMTSGGSIVGVPLEATGENGVTARVIASSNSSDMRYEAEMTVKVSAVTTQFTVTVGEGISGSDGTYYIESGKDFSFSASYTLNGENMSQLIYASVLDDDGNGPSYENGTLSGDAKGFTVKFTGSGTFKIVVFAGPYDSKTLTVNVIENAEGVSAAITVGSSE